MCLLELKADNMEGNWQLQGQGGVSPRTHEGGQPQSPHSRAMGRRAGWSTDRSVSGTVLQRESTEPKHCTSDFTTPDSGSPSRVPPTQEHDNDQDPGALLTVLAAALAQGPRAPRIEAAFHCRLRRDAQVERRALHELGVYYLVSGAQLAGWSRV